MNVLITGEGGLSKRLREFLEQYNIQAECMSLRRNLWKKRNFEKFNCVVHVAGVIPKKKIQREEYYSVNRDLTLELANKVKASNIELFIYISSMAVYNVSPTTDTNKGLIYQETCCNPQSDYGKSKYEAEKGLLALENDTFKVAIIRAPSIYSEENIAYLSQYELLIRKFKLIPDVYTDCYRSSIYADNLCELIRLIICTNSSGLFFPDDGELNAVDYCTMIAPKRKKTRLFGMAVKIMLNKNPVIRGIYGQIAYDRGLTEAFNGEYRIVSKEQISERLSNVRFRI